LVRIICIQNQLYFSKIYIIGGRNKDLGGIENDRRFRIKKKNYKEMCKKYMSITGVEDAIYKAELIICDDVQLDCELLVIDDKRVVRRKYIYFDTPKLNRDDGYLKVEEKREFLDWNDIDYFVDIAREDPDKLFEC